MWRDCGREVGDEGDWRRGEGGLGMRGVDREWLR